jgi:hypothetical protein
MKNRPIQFKNVQYFMTFSSNNNNLNQKKVFRSSSSDDSEGKGLTKNMNPISMSTYLAMQDKDLKSKKPKIFANLGKNRQENLKQVVSITYEEIGLFPRSFNRVFDRFFKQLFFDVENLVVQEYRFYRYLFLTTVKCLFILFFVPFLVNFFSKEYLIKPVAEYYWNSRQPEIFLNSYQQKRAFIELKEFEEKIYFDSLISQGENQVNPLPKKDIFQHLRNLEDDITENNNKHQLNPKNMSEENSNLEKFQLNEPEFDEKDFVFVKNMSTKELQEYLGQKLQAKTLQLAMFYNEESIEAITNFFADLMSFATLWFLVINLEIQINITKSFLLEVFFGLDDSKKSLLILFITDLLVGYHSPNIWELFFSSLFDHYGLPENQTTIFLLVATLPVLLDVLFKYLIFRHLNRASPATVATYHAMIE